VRDVEISPLSSSPLPRLEKYLATTTTVLG
jgi:hypothetical protein